VIEVLTEVDLLIFDGISSTTNQGVPAL